MGRWTGGGGGCPGPSVEWPAAWRCTGVPMALTLITCMTFWAPSTPGNEAGLFLGTVILASVAGTSPVVAVAELATKRATSAYRATRSG